MPCGELRVEVAGGEWVEEEEEEEEEEEGEEEGVGELVDVAAEGGVGISAVLIPHSRHRSM